MLYEQDDAALKRRREQEELHACMKAAHLVGAKVTLVALAKSDVAGAIKAARNGGASRHMPRDYMDLTKHAKSPKTKRVGGVDLGALLVSKSRVRS